MEIRRPLIFHARCSHDAGDDFSFSGLKTSVRYFLRDHPDVLNDAQRLRDLCASIQAAIVEVLVVKTLRAAKRIGVRCVTASGGVTCNRVLRRDWPGRVPAQAWSCALRKKNFAPTTRR